jgi:hypothetical protein
MWLEFLCASGCVVRSPVLDRPLPIEGLDRFLEICRATRPLKRDIAVVRNAMSEPWSNGQTVGQISKLKTLKRAMFGRAGTELLCAGCRTARFGDAIPGYPSRPGPGETGSLGSRRATLWVNSADFSLKQSRFQLPGCQDAGGFIHKAAAKKGWNCEW